MTASPTALRIRYRLVGTPQQDAYSSLWSAFQAAAHNAGARAWAFRSVDRGDLFIEFLEYRGIDLSTLLSAVRNADEQLLAAGAIQSEGIQSDGIWEEWTGHGQGK